MLSRRQLQGFVRRLLWEDLIPIYRFQVLN
jgi:hypothetical protein